MSKIVPFYGEFGLVPIPLEVSHNFCSHKCSYCTTGDTFITLANLQQKQIKDVTPGDTILGWVGDTRFHNQPMGKHGFTESVYRKWNKSVVNTVNTREAEVFQVTLADGSTVKCTADHKWFTGRTGEMEYRPLKSKNRQLSQLTQLRFKGANELPLNDAYMIGYIRGFCEGDGTWMPQKTWRIACGDVEVLYRINCFLAKLGFQPQEIKPFLPYENMVQIVFSVGDPINELINGLDIESMDYWRGWLAGIYDAEGNTPARLNRSNPEALSIAQYKSVNILTYNRIERTLRLFGFGFVCGDKVIRIVGGRLEAARFVQLVQPAIERKANPLIGSTHKGIVQKQEIVSIVSIGVQTVYSLSTSTGNYIANGFLSSNCFANLNNPTRKADVKGLFNQLKGYKTQKNLAAIMLQNKFAVAVSNKTDPFALSNYRIAVPMMEALANDDIPMFIQTRGGTGVDDVLKFLKPSLFYISITHSSDETRKFIEPAAPTIESRWALIDKLKAHGHKVMVAVNPYHSYWVNNDEMMARLEAHKPDGLVLQLLHLNWKQIANMSEKEQKNFTERSLAIARKRNVDDREYALMMELHIRAQAAGIKIKNYNAPELVNDAVGLYHDIYGKQVFRTKFDFVEWCRKWKDDNDLVTFDEYKGFMLHGNPLAKGEYDIKSYLTSQSKEFRNGVKLPSKMAYADILKIAWNDPNARKQINGISTFAALVLKDGETEYAPVDKNNNLLFVWNSKTFDDDITDYSNQLS